MKTKKEKKEYYILAGKYGIKEMLLSKGINLSPDYFMIVSENSKIGRLIKNKARLESNRRKKNNDN